MVDLLDLHKYFMLQHIGEGDRVADFTMGNGNDTLWLSKTVGEMGKVYAFDVQEQALQNTEKRLREAGAPENYELILDSHSNLKQYITEPIKGGMFNLGWLPGSDKKYTTMRETTRKAVTDAMDMLADNGVLLIAVYPGHEEGTLEGDMLRNMLSEYPRWKYCCSIFRILNSPASPFFYLIEKK